MAAVRGAREGAGGGVPHHPRHRAAHLRALPEDQEDPLDPFGPLRRAGRLHEQGHPTAAAGPTGHEGGQPAPHLHRGAVPWGEWGEGETLKGRCSGCSDK